MNAGLKAVRTVMLLAVTVLALVVPTAALAGAPDQTGVVERAPQLSAWVFFDGELVVLTGPELDAATCVSAATGEFSPDLGFQYPEATIIDPPGADTVVQFTHRDQVRVYDAEGATGPMQWLGMACGGILGGAAGPTTLANGHGLVRFANGVGGVAAEVVTADGRTVRLNAVGKADSNLDRITYGG